MEHSKKAVELPASCEIIRAFYGDVNKQWDLTGGSDVTKQVRRIIARGGILPAHNALFGDPAKGRKKALLIHVANQQCGPFNHLGKVDPKQCRVHTPVWTEPSNILLPADAVDVEDAQGWETN